MVRGTTAQFKFKLPFPVNELTWATIKFWQPNNPSSFLPITKRLSNCESTDNPNELCVSLLESETMLFSDKYKGKMQLRARHENSATTFGSRPQLFTVYPMNDDILEEDPMLPAPNNEGWVILDGEAVHG